MAATEYLVLEKVPQAVRERLAFIEYRAFFCGRVQRGDIEAMFSLSEPAATRDLSTYRKLAPDNLRYDARDRAYVPRPKFTPLFAFEPQRVLGWLSTGFIQGLSVNRPAKTVPSVRVIEMGLPDLDVLASVTRAIHNKQAVRVNYLSFSSGESTRELVPHAIVDNGIRWHVRAFDRAKKKFSDFVIARMADAAPVAGNPTDQEGVLSDHQWNRMVDLELVPHPGLVHPEVVLREFQMIDGVLHHQCRAAVVGYLLRLWGVDITEDHEQSALVRHLWLRNRAALYGVESLNLAVSR